MTIARYVKIGLFFITLGVSGSVYVVMSSDGFNRFNTKDYEVLLSDATGLTTNSKVYLAGVPVGKIHEISLQEGQAVLRISFLKDVEIRSDAQISRRSSSILGTSILSLSPGTELSPVIGAGGRILSGAANRDLTAAAASVQDLSIQLSAMLKEVQEQQLAMLSVSIETFNSISKKLDERSDAELDRITRILESTAAITNRVDLLLAERGDDLGASAGELRLALENLRAVSDEIRAGKGNLGRSVYEDGLYANLLETAEQTNIAAGRLGEAIDSVNRLAVDSDRVVSEAGTLVSKAAGLGVQVDSNARYDLLSGNLRAGASIRLEPRSADRWYRIGVSSDPDGIASRVVSESSVDGVVTVTDTTETSYTVGIDAELARRFGPVTLRGGLLESTAGVGIDYSPVGWLAVSGEVFAFRKDAMPNLRGTLTVYPFFDPSSLKPWNWVYLSGGMDSALDSRRDWFVGAGLRFNDEEVRGLVGLVPWAGN